MYPQKAQKIDLTAEYPCPCRRRGRLVPIALTEALGCDRCQQIFVVSEDGYAIEELSTTYPYKQTLRWTGHHWCRVNRGFRDRYAALMVAAGGVLLAGFILLYLAHPENVALLVPMAALCILLSIPLGHWFGGRR